MQKLVLFKKMSLFFLLTGILIACQKKNDFNYTDGTPGDGEPVPNVTVDTSNKGVDVSKYAQARVFPGLICADEPRLQNQQLTLNLDYNYVGEKLRINVPPQPQFSTGLYAAPGELVTIDVPMGDYSLSAQIGAWTDNLSALQSPPRDPIIYTRTQLAPGRNYLRNLYGGHIYIFAGRPIATPVNLTFSNVVKSPDFVLGKTSNEEWKAAVQASCVPWLELRSENMIFVVPREYVLSRPITDATAAMQEWDNIIKYDFYEWEGLVENSADPVDKAPLLPWRVVLDIKPVVGYGHSGFPIVAQNDYSWYDGIGNVAMIDGGGNWGYYHEIGHNNQQPSYWSWSSLGETTNNLFAFKVANRLQAQIPQAWPPKHPALASAIPNALNFAKDGNASKNFDGTDSRINDPFARLTPFLQIFDKVPAGMNYDSWGFMTELYKRARRARRISLTDQDKRDFVYEALCEYTKHDWSFFFKAWGITISNISLTKMQQYPVMSQKIWEYNPLTRTGGDAVFNPDPYAKSNWTVSSFSSEEAGGEGPVNGYAKTIIDGDVNTFWHSRWSTGGGAPPHVLVVDMGKSLAINGFVFTQRQSLSRNIINLRVETSNDGTNWTAVAGSPFLLASAREGQTKGLPAAITCRYFRMTVPSNADVYDGSQFAALAEVDVLKAPDPYYKGNWTVSFSSEEAGGEGPTNGYAKATIDGNINTFWHSRWSGSAAVPPHVLTYDMKQTLPVNGLVFAQRQSLTTNIKNIRVETSTDGVSWTAVNGSPFALAQTKLPQVKSLPATASFRYFRLTVPSNADVFSNNQFAALAEVDVIHP
jgi:hypothetical protein